MNKIAAQTDDLQEFYLLTDYLNLDTSFETMYTKPTELDCCDKINSIPENVKYAIENATSLGSNLETQF